MRKILSLALIVALGGGHWHVLAAQEQQPTGVVAGTATSTTGAALSGVTIQALGSSGAIAGSAVTARDGSFSIPTLYLGTYTVQCIDGRRVLGTASVTLSSATAMVRLTCAVDPAAPPQKNRRFLLAALGAAAAAIGAVAVVARNGDASPAR